MKAAEFTSKKISGLDVRARESYLALFEAVLRTNYDNYEQFSLKNSPTTSKSFTSYDIRQAAIDSEYQIFSSNKVVTMYRRKMAFLMAEVKRKTDAWELHVILSEFDPNKDVSTIESNANIDKESGLKSELITGGFQTALELSKNQNAIKNTKDEFKSGVKDIASYFDLVKPNVMDKHADCTDIEKNYNELDHVPKVNDTFQTKLEVNDSECKNSSDSSSKCKMKEPNKNRDKENKHTSLREKELVSKTSSDRHRDKHSRSKNEHREYHKSSSKESNHSRGSKKESSKDKNETELEKALQRIKELEESNKMLAEKRIHELEKENKKLCNSARKETPNKEKHCRGSDRVELSSASDLVRKRKQSTASSSSTSSSKHSQIVKSDSVQSKLKLLGLSDSNSSGDENDEDQQAAFENLFGGNESSLRKNRPHKEKPNSTGKCSSAEHRKTAIKGSSTAKQKRSHKISERGSSSSPDLSDLEEKMKVEQEVMQIVADEKESENEYVTMSNDTSEHEQLAAWLGNILIYIEMANSKSK